MAVMIKKRALQLLGKVARFQGEWQSKKYGPQMTRIIGKEAWNIFQEIHEMSTLSLEEGRVLSPEEEKLFVEGCRLAKIETLKHLRDKLEAQIRRAEEEWRAYSHFERDEVVAEVRELPDAREQLVECEPESAADLSEKEIDNLLFHLGGRIRPMRGVHKYRRINGFLPAELTHDQLEGLRDLGVEELEQIGKQLGVSPRQLWLFFWDNWGVNAVNLSL